MGMPNQADEVESVSTLVSPLNQSIKTTMTPPPESKTLVTTKRSPFFFVGVLLSALGGGIAGAFIARQFMEAGTGHTYYEFIAGGAVIAMIGIAIAWKLRRKNQ